MTSRKKKERRLKMNNEPLIARRRGRYGGMCAATERNGAIHASTRVIHCERVTLQLKNVAEVSSFPHDRVVIASFSHLPCREWAAKMYVHKSSGSYLAVSG